MNRADFQKLAALRIREAKVLLDAKCYEGAYYLAGYAVECALKACIAKKTRRFDFPPKEKEVRDYYTHNLVKLVAAAKLGDQLEAKQRSTVQFRVYWNVVTQQKGWTEGARYETQIDEKRAHDLYSAIADRRHGVLQWLKKFW